MRDEPLRTSAWEAMMWGRPIQPFYASLISRSFILIDDNPMALEEFENLNTALRSALT